MRPGPIFGVDAVLLVVGSLVGFALVALITRLIGERLLDEDRRRAIILPHMAWSLRIGRIRFDVGVCHL